VFKAPDAQKATVDTANGGRISVATSRRLKEMAVDTGGLPALSGQQVYQLWAISGGTPASVGLLRDTGAGKAMELPARGTTVAITIEPAGGSEQPTTQPIVVVDPSRV
jgi:anti-sigma-K factor RskA